MKRLKIILFIIGILLVIISKTASAQKRPENTSSARAYYGSKVVKQNFKANKTRVNNYTHTRPAKGTQVSYKNSRRRIVRPSWAS